MPGINLYISDSVLCTYIEPTHMYRYEKIVDGGRTKYYSQDLVDHLAGVFDVVMIDTGYGNMTHRPETIMNMGVFKGVLSIASYHNAGWLAHDLMISDATAYALVIPYIPPTLVAFLQEDKAKRFNVGISTYNDIADASVTQALGTALTNEDIEYLAKFAGNAKQWTPPQAEMNYYEALMGGY